MSGASQESATAGVSSYEQAIINRQVSAGKRQQADVRMSEIDPRPGTTVGLFEYQKVSDSTFVTVFTNMSRQAGVRVHKSPQVGTGIKFSEH